MLIEALTKHQRAEASQMLRSPELWGRNQDTYSGASFS